MRKVMLLAEEEICDSFRQMPDTIYTKLPIPGFGTAEKILPADMDALILQMSLPGTDGLTFLKENAAVLPPTVIVLTAYYDDNILRIMKELGVSSVIRIPCRASYVAEQLAELLAKKMPLPVTGGATLDVRRILRCGPSGSPHTG